MTVNTYLIDVGGGNYSGTLNRYITAKQGLHEIGLLRGGLTQIKVFVKKMIHLRIHYNHDNQMMTIKIDLSHRSRPASIM